VPPNADLRRPRIELPDWDASRCIGCGTCVEVCPRECLARTGRTLRLTSACHCVGCGVCEALCPGAAITLREQHD